MNIITMYAPLNSPARPGYFMQPRYITIHNTANLRPTATAVSHGKYLQSSGALQQVSYHYVTDEKDIVQCIPDNEVAWHAGDGKYGEGNRNSLAIEICENEGASLLLATEQAAKLTAFLMERYHIPIENVVQHNVWCGKNCPNRIRKSQPYDWQTFLEHVALFADKKQPSQSEDKEEINRLQLAIEKVYLIIKEVKGE